MISVQPVAAGSLKIREAFGALIQILSILKILIQTVCSGNRAAGIDMSAYALFRKDRRKYVEFTVAYSAAN